MKSQKLRSQDDQKLPKVLEERLIFWIWQRCNARQPPSHLEVRKMASAYIGRKDGNLLGKTWLKKFLERNPEARPMRTVAVDNNRLVLPVTLQPQWGWNKKIKSQLQAEWRRRQD